MPAVPQVVTKLSREIRMFLPLGRILNSRHADQCVSPREATSCNENQPKEKLNRWMSLFPVSLSDPYVVVRVSIVGKPDPVTGYLVDIRNIDRWTSDSVEESLAKFLTQFEPAQISNWPSILFQSVRRRVESETCFRCDQVEVSFSPFLRFTSRDHQTSENQTMPSTFLTQQFEFSAAHRLHSKKLSDSQNKELFGKCNHPSGHGHNYRLEVCIKTSPISDSQKPPCDPWQTLNKIVTEEVLDRLDHKFLNIDLVEFQELNPSVENIAAVIHQWLQPHFGGNCRLAGVRLFETEKTWAEVGFGS